MKNTLKISELLTGYKKGRPVVARPFSAITEPGQIIGIIGRNGSGKTTLLRTICCLLEPLSGKIFFDDRNVESMSPIERAKSISYIMANNSMIPDIPVYDVVSMGRFSGTGWVKAQDVNDRTICKRAIAKTGIEHLLNKQFQSISDGEKQRALFAMALAQNTPVMLFDEPAAFLDIPARNRIYNIMHDLSRSDEKTVIFSTHDTRRAIEICDIIWAFTEDSVESGPPELLGMNNVFGNIFSGDNLTFDTEKMDFVQKNSANTVPIAIKGSGNRSQWTVSLLERLGFDPKCNIPAPISVIINENDESWTIQKNDVTFTTSSFAEFTGKMKSLIKNQPL